MKRCETGTIGADFKQRAIAVTAARLSRTVERVAGTNQPGLGRGSIAVGRESVKAAKARAIRVDGKHRAIAGQATDLGGAKKDAIGKGQAGKRAVPIGAGKTMQVGKTRAIGADGEHHAKTGIAAGVRRAVENAARQQQAGKGRGPIAVGVLR